MDIQKSTMAEQNSLIEDKNKKLAEQNQMLKDIKSNFDTFMANKSKLINFYFNLDYLWNIPTYWDKITIILCFNIFSGFNLSSLAFSFLLGRYGNIIIDRYNLHQKFPKLEKFFLYRWSLQKYYFIYLTGSAILIVFMTFITNIIFLLIHYDIIT
uniref:hypothetical protein n=1 Tax=Daedaleopsis nitida TaxID=1140402 RepID=UPI0030DF3EE5